MYKFQIIKNGVVIGETSSFKITDALSEKITAERNAIVDTLPIRERFDLTFKTVKV